MFSAPHSTQMSHRKVDLKLNLAPRGSRVVQSSSPIQSPTSPPSSCVSSDESTSNSPEATTMKLVGCPRCLMYVMLSEEDPKCPKCKSTVLLDVINGSNNNNTNNNNSNKKKKNN